MVLVKQPPSTVVVSSMWDSPQKAYTVCKAVVVQMKVWSLVDRVSVIAAVVEVSRVCLNPAQLPYKYEDCSNPAVTIVGTTSPLKCGEPVIW